MRAPRWSKSSPAIPATATPTSYWATCTCTRVCPKKPTRTLSAPLAIDPDSFAAAYGLGRARFKSGDFTGAITALRQALAQNPDHLDTHYALGLAYVRQASYRDARAHFSRSIALDPDHAESHYGLALILMQQGQREQARQALQKVLALAPDHQRAQAKLGELDQEP